MRTWMELAALAVLLVAVDCGSGSMRMNALRSEVTAARSENELHWRNVQSLNVLTAVGDEEARHDDVMNGSMASMNDGMSQMTRCNMTAMTAMTSEMATMMLLHDTDMRAAQTMEQVQSLGAAHHADMGRLLDEMDGTLAASDCSM